MNVGQISSEKNGFTICMTLFSNFCSLFQFHNADDAKKALEQLNGFELAGRPMKVGNVTERTMEQQAAGGQLDTDELDRAGIDLGATGRLQLMAKLAEGRCFIVSNHKQHI